MKGLEVEENPSSPRYRRASKALLCVFMKKNLLVCDLYAHTQRERQRETERGTKRLLVDLETHERYETLLIKYEQAKSF